MRPRLLILVASILAAAAAPAAAQVEEEPFVTRRILSGECPRVEPGQEIVVCGRRDEDDRYRLPLRSDRFDPRAGIASVSRERNRLLEGEAGGLGSCTNVGPGGMTGCFGKGVDRRRQQLGR